MISINTTLGSSKFSFYTSPLQLPSGTEAPDFTLVDLKSDETFSLRDFQGKVIILDLFATWCGPCRAAIPFIREIYHAYSRDELEIISIDTDPSEGESLVLSFTDDNQMEWIVALDNNSIIRSYYGSGYIPTMYIIDQNQNIAYSEIGFNFNAIMDKLVDLGLEQKYSISSDNPSLDLLVLVGIFLLIPIVGIIIIVVIKFSEKSKSLNLKTMGVSKKGIYHPPAKHKILYCTQCGEKIEPFDRFCTNCGRRIL
ncbi:MAG: redoxin domain-containing protein [Promethearchaeota archaeon]